MKQITIQFFFCNQTIWTIFSAKKTRVLDLQDMIPKVLNNLIMKMEHILFIAEIYYGSMANDLNIMEKLFFLEVHGKL